MATVRVWRHLSAGDRRAAKWSYCYEATKHPNFQVWGPKKTYNHVKKHKGAGTRMTVYLGALRSLNALIDEVGAGNLPETFIASARDAAESLLFRTRKRRKRVA